MTKLRLAHGKLFGDYLVKDTRTEKTDKAKKRLEELRKIIRSQCVSYGELAELQSLAKYIEAGDVELAEWAGIPEEEFAKRVPKIVQPCQRVLLLAPQGDKTGHVMEGLKGGDNMKEIRVYVLECGVDTGDDFEFRKLEKAGDFEAIMNEAELRGSVYSLAGFQEAINSEELSLDNSFIYIA